MAKPNQCKGQQLISFSRAFRSKPFPIKSQPSPFWNFKTVSKEFLKPEFLRITNDGETVLHALARLDRLDLVPEVYRDDEMWNFKNSFGETPRERQQRVLEWKIHRDAYASRVRAEPATEKQKEKLRYFGYDFDENITKGQASDALDKCARDFPQANQTYYSRPATEEQLAKLREINTCCKPGERFYDFEDEGLPTYGEAKDSLQDWELYKREQVENSDLMDCMDAYWEKHHWDDDYEESERGRFDNACFEILDGWQFEKFGDLPTRKQVAKIWKLVKSRKSNKAELPTHGELIAALLESRGGIGRPRG